MVRKLRKLEGVTWNRSEKRFPVWVWSLSRVASEASGLWKFKRNLHSGQHDFSQHMILIRNRCSPNVLQYAIVILEHTWDKVILVLCFWFLSCFTLLYS